MAVIKMTIMCLDLYQRYFNFELHLLASFKNIMFFDFVAARLVTTIGLYENVTQCKGLILEVFAGKKSR